MQVHKAGCHPAALTGCGSRVKCRCRKPPPASPFQLSACAPAQRGGRMWLMGRCSPPGGWSAGWWSAGGGRTSFQCALCGSKITQIIYFNSHTHRWQHHLTPEAVTHTVGSHMSSRRVFSVIGAFCDTGTFGSHLRAWVVVKRFSGNQDNYIKP
jgi:hypothetical protein